MMSTIYNTENPRTCQFAGVREARLRICSRVGEGFGFTHTDGGSDRTSFDNGHDQTLDNVVNGR